MKNIFIFCSWLEPNTKIGVFFVEQAKIISDTYNPILVVFKKNNYKKKCVNYKNQIQIKQIIINDLKVLQVYYPFKKSLPKFINVFFRDLALKRLNDFVIKNKIDISFVHAQSIFDAGIWAYQYKTKFKTPYIITEHNQLTFINSSRKKSNLIVNSLKNSSRNLVVSNDKIRQFYANGLYFDFLNVGNLIDPIFRYTPRKEKTNLSFITIGAFTPIKDQLTLLNALKRVDSLITKEIDFVWIGYNGWGGDFTEEMNKLVSDFKFKNIKTKTIPILERNQIVEYLNQSDLFLFSSISEGMPVSVLEALACGLPVFSSNCGGVDEVIDDTNGKIYQIKDDKMLAQYILDFIEKEKVYNNDFISNSILNKYGADAFREKLLTIYNSIK